MTPIVPLGSKDAVRIVRLFGGLMARGSGLETLPPGLTTVTLALPRETIRLAGTLAHNWLPLTYLIDSADPFHMIIDPVRKPEPLT